MCVLLFSRMNKMSKKYSKSVRKFFEKNGFIDTGLGKGSHSVYRYDAKDGNDPISTGVPHDIPSFKQINYRQSWIRMLRKIPLSYKTIKEFREIPLSLEEDDKEDLKDLEVCLYYALNNRDVVTVAKTILKISKSLSSNDLKNYSCPPLKKYEEECDEVLLKSEIKEEIYGLLERLFKGALNEHILQTGFARISCKSFDNEYPDFDESISNKFGMKIIDATIAHAGADFELEGVFVGGLEKVFGGNEQAAVFRILIDNDSGNEDDFLYNASGVYSVQFHHEDDSYANLKTIRKELEKFITIVTLKGSNF